MKQEKRARSLWKNKSVQSLVASLLCILMGLLIGYVVLLIINPHHMRLLGLPQEEMTRAQVAEHMTMHLSRCQASLEAYFELALDIKRIVSYDDLYALGRENMLRTAH